MAKAIDYKIPEGSKLLFEVKHLFRGGYDPHGLGGVPESGRENFLSNNYPWKGYCRLLL